MIHLTGKLVQLTSFTDTNITSTYVAWLNDPALMKYSNQRFHNHSFESCKTYLESFIESDNLFLAVYHADQFIGTMTAYRSLVHQTTDIGLLIGSDNQGKGLGKDAWVTLMNYLLASDTRKITGGALRGNTAMLRIMQSCGMKVDGVRIAQELVDDQPQDILHFATFNAP